MNVNLTKDDLKSLVKTSKPNSMQVCHDLTQTGQMKFTGNQHNENWEWTDDYLESLSEMELWNLYQKHK